MIKNVPVIALIPARGGSKRLPGKNIKPLLGKPLIAWTIDEARKSKYIDRIVVSTDSEEIAKVSKRHGAEVPFIRPEELATDEAKAIDVIHHAIQYFERYYKDDFVIIYLQPTSPLRTVQDIDNALELLFRNPNARAIVSVCECEHHPLWSNMLPSDGCMKDFLREEILNKNFQELPKYYRLNGAIYLGFASYVKSCEGFWGEQTYAYVMPVERSVDIDNILDFKLAEVILMTFDR